MILRRCRSWRTIDVGGGKYKVAIVAWLTGFRNLGYVEFDNALCDVAARNFHRLGMTVKVTQCDALEQSYPDPVCLLLYNPFQRETTERFLDGLVGHRDVVIVYVNSKSPEIFEKRRFIPTCIGSDTRRGFTWRA